MIKICFYPFPYLKYSFFHSCLPFYMALISPSTIHVAIDPAPNSPNFTISYIKKYLSTLSFWVFKMTQLMLKLKFQCFGHLMRRANSLEKTLMLGKIEGRRRRGRQRLRWLNGITNSMDMNVGKLREMVRDREAWCTPVHGVTKSPTQLSDWTTFWRNVV